MMTFTLISLFGFSRSFLRILLANSTFEGTFYFSQARKVVHIPHREEKKDPFWGIFPHFLNSPTVSFKSKGIFDKTFRVVYKTYQDLAFRHSLISLNINNELFCNFLVVHTGSSHLGFDDDLLIFE